MSSLYTNIGHENAISATKWAMNKYSNLISKQKKFILRCLAFGLQHNYFWFNSEYYRQLNGIGMGAKYAPSVANLFMSEWEEQAIYNNTPTQLIMYRRFIDDCIMLWKGKEEPLRRFLEELNNNEKNIELNYEVNTQSAQFLDLEIELTNNGTTTKTFFKPVKRNRFIPVDSCLFDPWLINIPKGQFVHLRRNCTEKNTFLEQAGNVGEKFVQKGYNRIFIEEKIKVGCKY